MMSMKNKHFDLLKSIRDFFSLTPFEDIIPWAEKYINFSDDVSAQRDRLDFAHYKYQVEILKSFADLSHIKTIVVCAPEQMGKTNIFVISMLWHMVFNPRTAVDTISIRAKSS